MGYIICAEVDLLDEENIGGVISTVKARILSERNNIVTFDIKGEFGKQPELVTNLCQTLVDSGFYSFSIRHSY